MQGEGQIHWQDHKGSKEEAPQATLGPQSSCHTCARPKARLGSKNSKMILICVGELQNRWKTLGT